MIIFIDDDYNDESVFNEGDGDGGGDHTSGLGVGGSVLWPGNGYGHGTWAVQGKRGDGTDNVGGTNTVHRRDNENVELVLATRRTT